MISKLCLILFVAAVGESVSSPDLVNLPDSHLPYYFNSFPDLKHKCQQDGTCIYRKQLEAADENACWGFERHCNESTRFQTPICKTQHNKKAQLDTFYAQADFGFVREQREELKLLCTPTFITDSSLECSQNLRFCRGRNLMVNLTALALRNDPIRYNMDVLQPGEIGGHCQLDTDKLMSEMDHMGALQSWAPELRNFQQLPHRPIADRKCDIYIDKPTYIMKIDASHNMYHHFCDFFNLYASLFVNQSASNVHTFNTDTRILIWETYHYDSPFAETFKAFSDHPVWTLNHFKGSSVCFRNVVLPLLPRMIFGLFYNTPIIHGCEKSGLFRAFSEFILHRLEIPVIKVPNQPPKIRITYLARKTKFRQVLNEDELLKELSTDERYVITKKSFERSVSFKEQLEIVRNTDVLIGMHGAGLTHLLFLPNWATIFELYNCEDPNCYKDLARLRGVNYMTWENEGKVYPQDEGHHPSGGAHAKFTNYRFDKAEFARLVAKASDYVLSNEDFLQFAKQTDGHDEL